ncbi:hypothetical protein [Actinoplanes sp. NBRC 103695]|uniref:hypothetical protein n=1 Tax=Actinoplanes sp. NBRC 103695 TaxID=3032202 RepID=UPI0024A236DF|nr:hypothetical protein [Actinoplanes sp. NBRC 103695]GLY93106.1 hypothetical protein Acsp02_03620 [Actinoplanes sp. NBRC 103695]
MPSEVDLLRSLDDEPDTPSTIDIRKAMSSGRRRRARRQAGYAGAAALTAIAVTGTSVAINLSASPGPVAQPAASGAPRASAGATTPVTPAEQAQAVRAPEKCTIRKLKAPGGAPMALASGADPTGRYVVGRTYPKAGGYQAVIWDDGKGREIMLPGDMEESLRDVNTSGDAVGWSYVGDDKNGSGPKPYAYQDGKVVKMRAKGYAQPVAINDAGTIVGAEPDGSGLVWRSATAEPVRLPVPAGTREAQPRDIAEDGTVAGSLDSERAVVWGPDGQMRELPKPTIDGRPAVSTQAFDIRGDWVTGMASPERDAAAGPVYAVRWRLSTGTAEVVAELRDPADKVNAQGWLVGIDPKGYAVLVTGKDTVRLPDLGKHRPDGTATTVSTLSDDGTLIAGHSDDKDGVIQAVVWRCG